jgi:hypothetical protein
MPHLFYLLVFWEMGKWVPRYLNILRCEVFMWCHWCYINTSTLWRIAPFWNSIHAPSDTTFPKRYCAMPALNVTLSLIGWFESPSANGHRAYIEVRSWQNHYIIKLSQFHQFPNIWDWNHFDITTDVHSIHVPIYHIFWELQVAELPECIATRKME